MFSRFQFGETVHAAFHQCAFPWTASFMWYLGTKESLDLGPPLVANYVMFTLGLMQCLVGGVSPDGMSTDRKPMSHILGGNKSVFLVFISRGIGKSIISLSWHVCVVSAPEIHLSSGCCCCCFKDGFQGLVRWLRG